MNCLQKKRFVGSTRVVFVLPNHKHVIAPPRNHATLAYCGVNNKERQAYMRHWISKQRTETKDAELAHVLDPASAACHRRSP